MQEEERAKRLNAKILIYVIVMESVGEQLRS